MERLKLMIPGPIQPEKDVLDEMGKPVLPHYGEEWTAIYNETVEILKMIFNTTGRVHILIGSGSSGIDACLGSALKTGEKIIVANNGHFGNRLCDIANGYGFEVISVPDEWGKPYNPALIEKALEQHPDARLVAAVHLETSTSIVNPIQQIGKIVRLKGRYFMVDAVSSLGGLPLKMDEWGIDLCASASQKCLGAPPGLSPVAIGQHGLSLISEDPHKNHGWYLNLNVWNQYAADWADWHPFPTTMATSNILALRKALMNLLQEGIDQRIARYTQLALRLRNKLRGIGLQPYTPDELLAPVLTTVCSPQGIPSSEIVNYMSRIHRIKIAGSLGALLKNKVFRIGHMSPTVSNKDIDQVVDALASFMAQYA
jgi:alanine-glyoxylate transaminase/serine-glyoxylate transaminase/serine-pyruvate transaminase